MPALADPLPPKPLPTATNAADEFPIGASVWPTGEVELPRFFVLDEHDFTDEKNGETVHLTKERLRHIAARENARRKRTGDLCPIVVGHTRDHAPETEQPPIVGYCTDFAVEPFFDTGKWAIACTPVAKSKDHVRYFREYPRRSVELWLNPDNIDPVALLGPTTPRRDLGLHKFNRDARPNHFYVLPEHEPTMTDMTAPSPTVASPASGGPDVVGDRLAATVMQLPIMKQLEEIMPLLMTLANQGSASPDDAEGDDLLEPGDMDESRGEDADEGEKKGEKDDESDEPESDESEDEWDDEEEEDDKEKPNKKNAAHCGPGNASIPGSKKMSRKPTDAEIVAYHAHRLGYTDYDPSRKFERPKARPAAAKSDIVADQVESKKLELERKAKVKFQKENESLRKRIAELEEKGRVAEVTAELKELDELGVAYDPEVEIPTLVKLSKADREKRIAYVKRIATGSKPQPPVNPVPPEAQASVKFARDGGAKADAATGPATLEEAYALANKVARKEATLEDVFASLSGRMGGVTISASQPGVVPVR